MNEQNTSILEKNLLDEPKNSSSVPLNFKRVLARAIRLWYLIALSVMIAITTAFLVNRYTTRIYPVKASIIVREGDENAGAKFLYNNPLVNPYRNFFNELYIMRSYPLLQQVVEQLNFDVSWYREGNIKTVEIYDYNFPFRIKVLPGNTMPYGRSMEFIANDVNSFSLGYLNEQGEASGKTFEKLSFNDTVSVNGFQLYVSRSGNIDDYVNKHFIVVFNNPYHLARSYSGRLRASWAEQGSSVVNLDINGPIAEKEIDFLNKFIERYQQYDVDKKNQMATKSIDFLDHQLTVTGDSLKYYGNLIEAFKAKHGVTEFTEDSKAVYSKLQTLEAQKGQQALTANYFKYLEEYLASEKNEQIVLPSALGINDQVITSRLNQLMEFQFSLRMLGDKKNESNPLVVERKQAIAQLKRDILEGIRSLKATQNIQMNFLNKEISEVQADLDKLPESERGLGDIQRNYALKESMYVFLMEKRAEAGISRASTTSDIIIVNPPSMAGGPITPQPLQNYALAFAVGLLLPFAFFVLAELLNDKIQSKEDIEQLTSIPLIGGIGHNSFVKDNLVVSAKPKSGMAESFRALRSNLNYFTAGQDKKIIVITSSVSGEGKTFTTINLATVMAFAGKRVLIIGADMRKPKIFSDFNLTNEKGLSTYLSSMASLDEVIQRTPIENLYLMSGGPVPPNPSELLMSDKVELMLNEGLKNFDFIILDTPPVGLVSDAFPLIKFAHHTIFMVRQNYSPKQFLKNIQELFERRDIHHISILFNDIRKTGPGYGYGYGYNYGYGYGYGEKGKNGYGYYSE